MSGLLSAAGWSFNCTNGMSRIITVRSGIQTSSLTETESSCGLRSKISRPWWRVLRQCELRSSYPAIEIHRREKTAARTIGNVGCAIWTVIQSFSPAQTVLPMEAGNLSAQTLRIDDSERVTFIDPIRHHPRNTTIAANQLNTETADERG